MLDLIDAHDIINEDQDLETILAYVEQLESSSMLENCSPKMLQSLRSSMNDCLHSKKTSGKLNGLVTLQFMVQECSDEVFNDDASKWMKMIETMIKKMQVDQGAMRIICSTVRTLVKRAPQFPDVSR